MIHMSSQELFSVFPQTSLEHLDFHFSGVEIDSRKSCAEMLFIALKGDSFDGHEYAAAAASKGAVAAIVEHELALDIPQIVVSDTRLALARLANYWRTRINPLVVAITGSNGKTSVKEMLGRILSSQASTLVTPGNFNNDIGVPLTLFKLSAQDRYAVIEMGANHPQEIRNLLSIAEPDVVYVNNAQAAHIQGFGSLQGVAQAKGEMYQYCNSDAIAVFNQDEPFCDYWMSVASSQRRIRFSSQQPSDVSAKGAMLSDGIRLQLDYQQQAFTCELKVYGEHNIQNALAAITLAIACGIDAASCCQALQGFAGVKGRQQFVSGVNNSLIINDSYNANPGSLKAALKVLCALHGHAWLALGDMAEMGDESLQMHQTAVAEARAMGVEKLYTIGAMSCQAASLFGEDGYCFDTHEEMAHALAGQLGEGVNLLVKGSRSAGMEKLVELITPFPINKGVNHAV